MAFLLFYFVHGDSLNFAKSPEGYLESLLRDVRLVPVNMDSAFLRDIKHAENAMTRAQGS